MMTVKGTTLISALALLGLVNAASAQSTYGQMGISAATTSFTGSALSPNDDTSFHNATLSGTLGRISGDGVFSEIDVDYNAGSTPAPLKGLKHGGQVALLFGQLSEQGYRVLHLGTLSVNYEDFVSRRDATRNYIALELGRTLSEKSGVAVQLGYLGGQGGSDDSGFDAASNLAHVTIGAFHAISQTTMLRISASHGVGHMDGDLDHMNLSGLQIELTRDFSQRLQGYAQYRYTTYFQGDELDRLNETRAALGVRINFGDSGRRNLSQKLLQPNYMEWLAYTGGHME